MIKKLFLLFIIIGAGYYYWTTRPISHGPGIVAPDAPVQRDIPKVPDFSHKNFTLDPKAEIQLEARILSIKRYRDMYSDLTKTDVVFGWGPMSNEENLVSLFVGQEDRSLSLKIADPPIDPSTIRMHVANMHLISSIEEISNKINSFREGHIVNVQGFLVDAKSHTNGWELKTSLSRTDRGKGSSELLWVKTLTIHP